MSYSPLTDKYIPASTSNYTKGRSGQTIRKITWHHMAGNLSIESCGSLWQNPSRRASSNYGIGTDGRIGCYVQEEDRSWCSSSAPNDNQAITIEIANCGGEPNWPVSDAAIESAIRLTVDICQRRGIKQLSWTGNTNGTFTWHCMFTSTACPGPYLKDKTPWAVNEINKRLAGGDKPDLTWTKLDKTETWVTNCQPTCLWDFNHTTMDTCQSIKRYDKGEEIEIYGKVANKQLGTTYLLTEYSFTNKITNGFNTWDMVEKPEPTPPEPTPEWADVEVKKYVTAKATSLYDVKTGYPVKDYAAGEEVEIAQECTFNDTKWGRTQYSKDKGIDNGFKMDDLKEPEPGPTPDPTVGILQKIIQFIQHIIDLITGKNKE